MENETNSNNVTEVESVFVPKIYHAPAPSMVCQYNIRTKTGKTIAEREIRFENGVYFADTPEKEKAMQDCLKDMSPRARGLIKETSLEHAEQIAKQHQLNHSREHRAIQGPTTSTHIRDMSTTHEEARMAEEALRNGANPEETVEGAKSLFKAFTGKKPEVKAATK